MTHEEAMLAVLAGDNGPITARVFFARTMALLGETGDPERLARECGMEPGALLQAGESFRPTPRVI